MQDLFEDLLQQAIALQQTYYELSSDWNVFPYEKKTQLLKNYVGYGMYGNPHDITDNFEFTYLLKDQVNNIERITSKIIEHAIGLEYIYCIVLYNVIFDYKKKITTKKGIHESQNDTKSEANFFSQTPIFKFKRRAQNIDFIWFIDINGRIYKSWKDYLTNNNLMKCTMVLPKDGEYQPDPEKEYTETSSSVLVEYCQSPACTHEIVKAIDMGTTLLSFVGLGIQITSLLTPVAPVMVATGLATGIGAGLYSMGRTIFRLVDRGIHKESMTDKKAFEDYISISANILGIASFGATTYISKIASQGKNVHKAVVLTHDTINISSIVTSGIGIGYKCYNIATEEKTTTLNYLTLACDIFFFGNAIINLKISKNLIESNQRNIIDDFKKSLANSRYVKSFNKMIGKANGNSEIVREIKSITSQEQLLMQSIPVALNDGLRKMNLMLSEQNIQNIKTVYKEVKSYLTLNYLNVFISLLKVGFKIAELIINENPNTVGDHLSLVVEFLWNYTKNKIKENRLFITRLGQCEIITFLFGRLEEKLNELVQNLKEYLKTKFDIQLKFCTVNIYNVNTDSNKNINDLVRMIC